MRVRDIDPDVEARIEHLAHHCPHTHPPCQRCTDLAVWAVQTLVNCGWWAQLRRAHTHLHPAESETP